MPIRIECPACQARFAVADAAAGRQGKCPRCQGPITIPRLEEPSATLPKQGPAPAPAPPPVPPQPTPGSASDEGLELDLEPGLVSTGRRRQAEPVVPSAEAIAMAEADAAAAGDEGLGYELAGGASRAVHRRVRERAAARTEAPLRAAGEAAASDARPKRTPAEILAAFGQGRRIEPVRPTPLYRLWVGIIALLMILLPLMYVALIGLVGYGLYYHAVYNISVFDAVDSHNRNSGKGAFLVYVGPLIAGGVVLAFMLKPLFARRSSRYQTRSLDPSKEPLLFAFVDGVCQAVGAPRPVRIDVDSEVNASARLDRGIFSRELVLTIGLPLVAGLRMKPFAGVLAHEFGHFAQGAGMRMSYVINSINMWFARVVYERDQWDEALASGTLARAGGYGMAIAGLARVAVWLTRRVLWVLMKIGHLASSFLSRQQEYDADRYQARMIGGSAVAEVLQRVGELSVANQGAWSDVNRCWGEGRLPDDFARLVVANVPQIPEAVHQVLRQEFETGRTGLFDTHPASRDRAARALEDEPGAGLLQLDGPSTDLFRDFDGLSRLVTYEMYRGLVGPQLTREQLVPVSQVVAELAVAQEGFAAVRRYFLNSLGLLQPLPVADRVAPLATAELAEARQRLVKARKSLVRLRDSNEATDPVWDAAQARLIQVATVRTLLAAGHKVKASHFNLASTKAAVVDQAGDEAQESRVRARTDRQPFEAAAAERLMVGLALLEVEAIASRVPDAEILRDEARALLPCVSFLSRQAIPLLPELEVRHGVLHTILMMIQKAGEAVPASLGNAALRASADLLEQLTRLHTRLGPVEPYPFEHAQSDMTLRRFVLPASLPSAQEMGELYQIAGASRQRLGEIYGRALSRLAVAAEAVETSLGLEPLPVPEAPVPPAE